MNCVSLVLNPGHTLISGERKNRFFQNLRRPAKKNSQANDGPDIIVAVEFGVPAPIAVCAKNFCLLSSVHESTFVLDYLSGPAFIAHHYLDRNGRFLKCLLK